MGMGNAAVTDIPDAENTGRPAGVKLTAVPAAGMPPEPLVPHLKRTSVKKTPDDPAAKAPAGAPAEGGEARLTVTVLPLTFTAVMLPPIEGALTISIPSGMVYLICELRQCIVIDAQR